VKSKITLNQTNKPANQINEVAQSSQSMPAPSPYKFQLPVKEIIAVRHCHGYDIVTLKIDDSQWGGNGALPMKAAFNWRGEYIGDPKTARRLVEKRGILPELRTPTSGVCSIGFSLKDGKWYGWSHRAIYGFKGKNAKQKAMRFADSVS